MRRSLPLVTLFLILHAAVVRGEDASPPAAVAEHFGIGAELTTGSEGEAGPRAFAGQFVVWGPVARP